jgi:hypothetical protein
LLSQAAFVLSQAALNLPDGGGSEAEVVGDVGSGATEDGVGL